MSARLNSFVVAPGPASVPTSTAMALRALRVSLWVVSLIAVLRSLGHLGVHQPTTITGRRPRPRLDDERHVPGVASPAFTMKGEGTSVLEHSLAVLALLLAAGEAIQGRCSSASACSSQNRMSISRYIVVAVVRCMPAWSRA